MKTIKQHISHLSRMAFGLLLTATPLLAQEEGASEASATSLFGLLQQGGWAMYPLGMTALFMFFLIFYCWRETGPARFVAPELSSSLVGPLQQRDVENAKSICASSNAVVARCLSAALGKARTQRPDANREKVESSFIDNIEAEEGAIGQWINYLNVVAAVAPMIGLLGTVSGMISAFQTIGQVGMGDPSALASDIGEALVTTATGLVIGIPAMVAYFIFRNRLNANVLKTVEAGGDFIDELVEGNEG